METTTKKPLNTTLHVPAQPDITLTSATYRHFVLFLSFPSISEPASKQHISQSSFLPFPPPPRESSPPGCSLLGAKPADPPSPWCTSPQQPRSKGWYSGPHTPRDAVLSYFPHHHSHHRVRERLTSIMGCPQTPVVGTRGPSLPPILLAQTKFFHSKKVKAVGFLTLPLLYCREMFPQK